MKPWSSGSKSSREGHGATGSWAAEFSHEGTETRRGKTEKTAILTSCFFVPSCEFISPAQVSSEWRLFPHASRCWGAEFSHLVTKTRRGRKGKNKPVRSGIPAAQRGQKVAIEPGKPFPSPPQWRA